MNPILRNILAVVIGFIAGSIVNMSLVNLGPSIIPLPTDADVSTPEGLKAAMALFEPKHFIFPYLAHALGTLVGAFTAAKIGISKHMTLALIVGAIFTLGGLAMIMMVGGPTWFNAIDLLSYIPMAYLGGKLGSRRNQI